MNKLMLNNVRLSFPNLFKKSSYKGVIGKYDATFLINKEDKEQLKTITDAIKNEIIASGKKIPKNNVCLVDGAEKEYDGYENCYTLKASNDRKPVVMNRDKSVITEEDDIIYPGCYVNALIDFWVQDNQFGKRINANLLAVQFFKDGESFVKTVDVCAEFDELEPSNSKNKKVVDGNKADPKEDVGDAEVVDGNKADPKEDVGDAEVDDFFN